MASEARYRPFSTENINVNYRPGMLCVISTDGQSFSYIITSCRLSRCHGLGSNVGHRAYKTHLCSWSDLATCVTCDRVMCAPMFPERFIHARSLAASLAIQYLSVFAELLPKDRTFPVQVITLTANWDVWFVLLSPAANTLSQRQGFDMGTMLACRPAKYLLTRLNHFHVMHDLSRLDVLIFLIAIWVLCIKNIRHWNIFDHF